MVKVKQTEKVKKERNSSSCANRVLARKSERERMYPFLHTYAQFIPKADVE